MAADPRMIEMMSYYRDAELHGATLLLRLIKLMDDPDAQVKLSLHLAEETHHAWLWTNRIKELGGEPMKVLDGYQKRIGMRTVPRIAARPAGPDGGGRGALVLPAIRSTPSARTSTRQRSTS